MNRLGAALVALTMAGAIGPRMVSAQLPAVTLNHIVVVADSATYQAIGASAMIRDRFSGFRQETIHAGGAASWTGIYLFGKNTYIEMFAPGGIAGPAGAAMVSFGVEERGSLWRLRSALAAGTGRPVDSLLRNRARDGEDVPWFYGLSVQGAMTASRVPTWVMEYHPDYLRRWNKITTPTDLSRRTFLAEFYQPDRLLGDVVAATIAADSADRDRLVREAMVYGYKVMTRAGGTVLTGPDIQLTLVPATGERRGVVTLGLRLTHRPERAEEVVLGRSVLRIRRDGTAVWSF